MTGGKLSDEMVELFVGKQRGGYVAFFKHITRNCTGSEAHRPRDCEKWPQTAMEQGILTSVDDVKINAEALASEKPTSSSREINLLSIDLFVVDWVISGENETKKRKLISGIKSLYPKS
jgi:hypothetical protein